MKKIVLIALVLCAQAIHPMGEEDTSTNVVKKTNKKEKSCADKCWSLAKICCYIGISCYVAGCVKEVQKGPNIFDDSAMPDRPCTMMRNREYKVYCSDNGSYWWRYREDHRKDTPTACEPYQRGSCELAIAERNKDQNPDDYFYL